MHFVSNALQHEWRSAHGPAGQLRWAARSGRSGITRTHARCEARAPGTRLSPKSRSAGPLGGQAARPASQPSKLLPVRRSLRAAPCASAGRRRGRALLARAAFVAFVTLFCLSLTSTPTPLGRDEPAADVRHRLLGQRCGGRVPVDGISETAAAALQLGLPRGQARLEDAWLEAAPVQWPSPRGRCAARGAAGHVALPTTGSVALCAVQPLCSPGQQHAVCHAGSIPEGTCAAADSAAPAFGSPAQPPPLYYGWPNASLAPAGPPHLTAPPRPGVATIHGPPHPASHPARSSSTSGYELSLVFHISSPALAAALAAWALAATAAYSALLWWLALRQPWQAAAPRAARSESLQQRFSREAAAQPTPMATSSSPGAA